MRAVVDIGSNSVLLLVAERSASGSLTIRRDVATVARISEGAAARGTLSPEAIDRGLVVLRKYAEIASGEGVSEIEAVATEGLRMAGNSEEFLLPAGEILASPVRLISGAEEARLSYQSVALEHPDEDPLIVIDIGGASTELVRGRGLELIEAVSHRIGSVRLSERHVDTHPPSAATIEAIAGSARAAFAAQEIPPHPELFGLAGTVTTCAAVMLGLGRYERERVDRSRFGRGHIQALQARLSTWSLAELRAHPLIGPGRADLVVAGVTILLTAMEHCGAQTLVVRDRGLRYALI